MGTKGQILSISQRVQDTSILCFPTINLRGHIVRLLLIKSLCIAIIYEYSRMNFKEKRNTHEEPFI